MSGTRIGNVRKDPRTGCDKAVEGLHPFSICQYIFIEHLDCILTIDLSSQPVPFHSSVTPS